MAACAARAVIRASGSERVRPSRPASRIVCPGGAGWDPCIWGVFRVVGWHNAAFEPGGRLHTHGSVSCFAEGTTTIRSSTLGARP